MVKKINVGRKEIFNFIAILFAGFYIYQAIFGIISPAMNRSMFVFFGVTLVIINKPLKFPFVIIDYIILFVVVIGTIYFNLNYDRFLRNFGLPLSNIDLLVGTLMLAVTIESVRRQLGWTIAIMASFFLAYLMLGSYFPPIIAHRGFSWDAIVSTMYASTDGIYGTVTYVLAVYMFLFLVLGSFLRESGAVTFFLNLANAIMGHQTGGSAKAASIASFFVGMISGSASANVAITGQMTIPLMKENGYSPEVAGGTEAASSLGGTILPPIMGASAFIMVGITNIPYLDIIRFALIPAILYFLSVFLHCHYYAKRKGLVGIPREKLPDLKQTLKEGSHFFIPIIVLIVLLLRGMSLQRVALWSIVATFGLSFLRKESRMTLNRLLNALINSARTALPIAAVAGPVGIISTAVVWPGMSLRVSNMIMQLTGGSLALTIIFVFIIAYILGMGLSIIPSYMILATLAAPALINLGVPLPAAHLMVLWYAQLSTITPPVCLASYVAAGIAEASYWKTGMQGVMRAAAIIYLPIIFVYQPGLILFGDPLNIIRTVLTTTIAVVVLVAGLEGFFIGQLHIFQRLMLILSAFILGFTDQISIGVVMSFAIVASIVTTQLMKKRSN